ncbi:MAG: hypothetical protein LBS01_09775 [Prevotellaceae bacterium]|nr:hypothetical protein [Prevotellaceae bacterium]
MPAKNIRPFVQYLRHTEQDYSNIRPFVQLLRQTDLVQSYRYLYLCRKF